MEDAIADILRMDVVLVGLSLLGQEREREVFAQRVNTDVAIAELAQGPPGGIQTPTQTAVTLQRDRIAVVTSQDRTAIIREYPSISNLPGDTSRLAQIVRYALDVSETREQQIAAFGFNMQIVFAPGLEESAGRYIAERCSAETFDWEPINGSTRLTFLIDGQNWTFELQPRPRDDSQSRRLYLAVNLHVGEHRIPEDDEISTSLVDLRDKAINFLNQFHG